MTELTITASVGSAPAPNRPDDVRTVQSLLQGVQPPLPHHVSVNGIFDSATRLAIREFQTRFMSNPDGRVDPDGRTLYHLNNGFAAEYHHCNARQRRIIDRDFINAQIWLDVVNRRLGNIHDADMRRKVRNVFHINLDNIAADPFEALRFLTLRQRFLTLRSSLDQAFPLQCESGSSLFAAWVDLNDPSGTMHFPSGHFAQSTEQRTETIIHERSHTVFNISHDGMTGAGQLDFGQNPDDDNGFTHQQAMGNAYCFGWLATCLQPGYVPPANDVIVVPVRRH